MDSAIEVITTCDINGGNTEVARNVDDPEVAATEIQKVDEETVVQQKLDEPAKMEEEVNGDVKSGIGKKSITPVAKRKLRKFKANSTSNVENEPANKKRKLSDSVISPEDSMDFTGFDKNSTIMVETASAILQKLIAEAEALDAQAMKRMRRSVSKGPRQTTDNHSVTSNIPDANDLKMRWKDDTTDNLDKKEFYIDSDYDYLKNKDTAHNTSVSIKSPIGINRQKGLKSTNFTSSGSATSTSIMKQKSVDITNPLFKEPFKYGWKRELIYNKGDSENSSQKAIKVFYITPKGNKKVYNLKQVAEHLNTKELTIDNFTFIQEPIGINDSEYEIIREEDIVSTPVLTVSSPGGKKGSVSKRGGMSRRVISGKLPSSPYSSTHPVVKSSGKIIQNKTNIPTNSKSKVIGRRGTSQQKKDVSPPKESDMVTSWNNSSSQRRTTMKKSTSSYKMKQSLKKKSGLVNQPQQIDQRQYFMSTVCAGYNALTRIFQYLKVQELLRAARVCKMWRDVAAHPALWKTVRMKNSQVTDWDGLVASLQRHGTQHLDLRKMLISGESDSTWKKFVSVIPNVTTLVKLELCKCPVMVVEQVIKACPQLEVLSSMTIKCEWLNLEAVGNLTRCRELKLKAISGMSLHGDLTPLQNLTQLTHLSLTSVKELGKKKIEVLGSLINLETLELGECSDFPSKFGTAVLCKLIKLERLRLEKGQGTCCTFDILNGVAKLEKLQQLELVNFDVKNGFDKRLASCKNIKRLLIIPTYISQSATSNNMVLGGVTELSNSLTHFVWGVTLELLRVTELFVDQCNQMNKQVSGDSIPVLKPVPCLKLIENVEQDEVQKGDEKSLNLPTPQVDILPLPQLQKLLLTALPKTRVKILKIPFHATWRQSISDTSSQS